MSGTSGPMSTLGREAPDLLGLKVIRSPDDVKRLLGNPAHQEEFVAPSVERPALIPVGPIGRPQPLPEHVHGAGPQVDVAQLAAEERAAGTVPTAQERADDAVYRGLARSQQIITLGRLSLGAQLVDVRDREIWRGRCAAKTFRGFLIEEGIDPRSACQYMQVVRCFVRAYGFDAQALASSGISLLHEAALELSSMEIDRLAQEACDPDSAAKRLKSLDGFGPQPLPSPDEGMREAVGELVMAMQRMAKAEARALLSDRISNWRSCLGLDNNATKPGSQHQRPVTHILSQVDALTLEQRSDLFRLLGRKPEKVPPTSAEATPAATVAPSEPMAPPAGNPVLPSRPKVDARAAQDASEATTPFWRRGLRA